MTTKRKIGGHIVFTKDFLDSSETPENLKKGIIDNVIWSMETSDKYPGIENDEINVRHDVSCAESLCDGNPESIKYGEHEHVFVETNFGGVEVVT